MYFIKVINQIFTIN